MKRHQTKPSLLLLAVAVLTVTALSGCQFITNLFQGDIDVAGTWSYTNDWGTVTWTITSETFDDGSESGTIISYSNDDQYFIAQITDPMEGYDYDEGKYIKIFWDELDTSADVKVQMGGVYRSTADTDGSYYWAALADAEATTSDSVWWSEFTTYTAP